MIKINLLPFRKARKRENVRRQVNVYFLCLLFLFSLMLYFHFDLNHQLAELETRETSLQNELKTYEAITGLKPAYIMDISTIVAMSAGVGTVAVAYIRKGE